MREKVEMEVTKEHGMATVGVAVDEELVAFEARFPRESAQRVLTEAVREFIRQWDAMEEKDD